MSAERGDWSCATFGGDELKYRLAACSDVEETRMSDTPFSRTVTVEILVSEEDSSFPDEWPPLYLAAIQRDLKGLTKLLAMHHKAANTALKICADNGSAFLCNGCCAVLPATSTTAATSGADELPSWIWDGLSPLLKLYATCLTAVGDDDTTQTTNATKDAEWLRSAVAQAAVSICVSASTLLEVCHRDPSLVRKMKNDLPILPLLMHSGGESSFFSMVFKDIAPQDVLAVLALSEVIHPSMATVPLVHLFHRRIAWTFDGAALQSDVQTNETTVSIGQLALVSQFCFGSCDPANVAVIASGIGWLPLLFVAAAMLSLKGSHILRALFLRRDVQRFCFLPNSDTADSLWVRGAHGAPIRCRSRIDMLDNIVCTFKQCPSLWRSQCSESETLAEWSSLVSFIRSVFAEFKRGVGEIEEEGNSKGSENSKDDEEEEDDVLVSHVEYTLRKTEEGLARIAAKHPPPEPSAAQPSLDDRFKAAQEGFASVASRCADAVKLQFYGLFKQATVGNASENGTRPSWLDFKGRAKYDAWDTCKGLGTQDAMSRYVDKWTELRSSL